MELNTIQNKSNWGKATESINTNFAHVGSEIDKLKYAAYNSKLYPSLEVLQQEKPNPSVGDWAIVGDTIPGAIYRCSTEGIWSATGETGGGYGMNVTEKNVTENNHYGDIINNPDDEDLTEETNENEEKVMKLADKEYNAAGFSGLGRVYLRRNISAAKNVLTQDMMSKANTRYIIQYDYDLNGATINIPDDCVLDFQGGCFKNGNITFSNTELLGLVKFDNVIPAGSVKNNTISVKWFGAKGDGITDDTLSINIAHLIENVNISYPAGTYVIDGNYAPSWIQQFETYGGIYVGNNQTISFEDGAKLIFTESTGVRGTFYQSKGKKNVTFKKVYGVGNRMSDGEWGHGMWIITSNPGHTGSSTQDEWSDNIKILDCTFENMNGDSYCISGAKNVYMENCTAIANKRNGLTLSGATDIIVKNFTAKDINGAAPESAIDIESDWADQPIGNILIDGVNIINCKMSIWNILTNTKYYNIKIRNVYVTGATTSANCRIYNNPEKQDEKSIIEWENFYFIETNVAQSSSSNFIYLFDTAKGKGEARLSNFNFIKTEKIYGSIFYINAQNYSSLGLSTYAKIDNVNVDKSYQILNDFKKRDESEVSLKTDKNIILDNTSKLSYGKYYNNSDVVLEESAFNSRKGNTFYVDTEDKNFYFFPASIKTKFIKRNAKKYRLTASLKFKLPSGIVVSSPYITYNCSVIFDNEQDMYIVTNDEISSKLDVFTPTEVSSVLGEGDYGYVLCHKSNKKIIWWDGTTFRHSDGHVLAATRGQTSERPTTLGGSDYGFTFYDINLKKMILWNGESWTNLDGTVL